MKYIIIEKRVEQVWNDKLETYIIRQELEYIPNEGYDVDFIVKGIIEYSINNLNMNQGSKNIDIMDIDIDKCINSGFYTQYACDRTNEEYNEVYYIRVTEREAKTIFNEMEEA